MDVLDRIAAIQNGREKLLMEKNEHWLMPVSNIDLNGDGSMDDLIDEGGSKENKEMSDANDKVCNDQNRSQNIDTRENVEDCADYNEGYGGIVGEEIDRVFGVPDNNVDLKEDLCDLGLNISINEPYGAEKVKTNFMFDKPNLKTEDLIQFWSPGIQRQIERKATPKSRFQPKRKSCSRKVDYSDCKRRKEPKKKESIGGRLLKRFKKDDTTSRKTNRDLRVARRSVLEISKMKKLRKQTHQNRLRNEKNMKIALQSGGYAPVRSTNVTKPKEFNFTICNRTKMHTMSTRSDTEKPFEKKLRKDSIQHHEFKNENTIPVPFKFSLSQTNPCEKENWQSMAQAALDFQSKTPTRFRLKPSEEDKTFLEKKTIAHKTVTMPVTPKLLTRGRSRRYKVDAVKEQEEKEIEKMLNYKFKATEFNPKIVEKQGMYGVKNVPAPSTTELKPFDFKIEERIHNRTVAKDASLAQEDTSFLEKSKTTTSNGKLKPTKLKPFSFEMKDKERFAKKEEKIKEQILAEKKMHEFQATLLPSFSPDPLPDVQTKKTTKLKPFNISSGSLSYQSKLDLTLKMDAEEDKARREFKAQPANVVKKQPFQPITGLIPPTNISNIKLNTDSRAEERELQQYWKQQREKLAEEERLEMEKQKKIAEEAEIRELRKNAVHKAKPIPSYKPLEIKKSDIPLTEPKTPNLEVKKRAVARSNVSREISE